MLSRANRKMNLDCLIVEHVAVFIDLSFAMKHFLARAFHGICPLAAGKFTPAGVVFEAAGFKHRTQ